MGGWRLLERRREISQIGVQARPSQLDKEAGYLQFPCWRERYLEVRYYMLLRVRLQERLSTTCDTHTWPARQAAALRKVAYKELREMSTLFLTFYIVQLSFQSLPGAAWQYGSRLLPLHHCDSCMQLPEDRLRLMRHLLALS